MLKKEQTELFLKLVRHGIGNDDSISRIESKLPSIGDWTAIQTLANDHGLLAIVLDGLDKNADLASTLPIQLKLEWIGEALQNYEQRYELYRKAHAEMAKFYIEHGYRMMVLKGYACSLNWPRPEHRPCGDIDIWQFGQQKEADEALTKEKGIKIDGSHHHHTVFDWNGFMVENHYDFFNVNHHKSNVELESIIKDLAKDDSCFVELQGERVYLPSPNLQALHLLNHGMMHFAAEGITLRQILDWGFHAKIHHDEIDWVWLEDMMKKFGRYRLYCVFNAICVEDLGFDPIIFHGVQFDAFLKNRVLEDILSPEYSTEVPDELVKRVLFKFRRWYGNAWKHELCYNDTMWSAFWSGVWNHLLKPSSI